MAKRDDRARGKIGATVPRAAQLGVTIAAAGAIPNSHGLDAVLAGAGVALGLVADRVRERQRAVLERASESARMAPEALVRAFTGSPEGEELLIRAMDTARRASLKEKLRAIAESLARGITSVEAAVDETQLLRLLDDLDTAHVALLRVLGVARDREEMPRPGVLVGPLHYQASELDQLLSTLEPELLIHRERLLAVLSSHGLVREQTGPGINDKPISTLCITEYGQEVLRRFDGIAPEDSVSA